MAFCPLGVTQRGRPALALQRLLGVRVLPARSSSCQEPPRLRKETLSNPLCFSKLPTWNRPADVCGGSSFSGTTAGPTLWPRSKFAPTVRLVPSTLGVPGMVPFKRSHPMPVTHQRPEETLRQDQAWPSSPVTLMGPVREGWKDNE